MKDLKCKEHKAYRALRKPGVSCAACQAMFDARPHLVDKVTKPVRREAVIRRLDTEEKRHDFVRRENESYYQNSTAWHSPRGKK